MSVACPCCRASNDTGPACRRCKADLSLLFAYQNQQQPDPQQAVAALLSGDFAKALKTYRTLQTEN